MDLKNLTPHAVCIANADGVVVREIPSSGNVRVSTSAVDAGEIDGIPTQRTAYGEVDGLPEPVPGTMYIVSRLVVSALKEAGSTREDLLIPATGPRDGAVRDSEGRICAVRKFDRA